MSQGLYVVVEPKLQAALSAVRALRASSPEKRKQAALHPEAVIREILDQSDEEPSLFIETEKFAERVLDVSDWVPPILPWIKIASQQWAPPVDFGVRINGIEIPLSSQQLEQACDDMREAIRKGKPSIVVNGNTLPAKPENLAALQQLKKSVDARSKPEEESPAEVEAASKVLIIETNFHDTGYNKVKVNPRAGARSFPAAVKTTPKKHQEDGLRWLQNHWIEGSRGAMLCDDMGLGKTYQALAFCAWLTDLKASGEIPSRPILLVAPVGLLRTWEGEMETHLMQPGLGQLVRAYGEHLRGLKRGRHSDGSVGLDTAKLGAADIVLANYEAVSDYQLSFGAIQFSTVILDEAQKIKSPKARMTTAIKALNTDFMIAMTGTPVENRLADLWCIADAVQPGALGDLKKFSATYEADQSAVQGLRDEIWQNEEHLENKPKLLLRRLKTDKLEGLPEKVEHVFKEPMPPRQLEAYARAIAIKEHLGPSGTLGMIQALRSISLHPYLTEGKKSPGVPLNVEDSARFTATFQILDEIHRKGEKALVFLESLDLQSVELLPTMLQRRYGMAREPMVINGEVSTDKRQERVSQFQKGAGFDVMLLSPKAGGVGLTLTAANHVIHLSRWWNPAVEDQCSDRVYRIGQTKTVHVYYPMAVLPLAEEHSFDMQLQVLMNRKRTLARNLLVSSAFTKSDYEDLVRGTAHMVDQPAMAGTGP
jgi:SNF2 family DNA or RNA helicase